MRYMLVDGQGNFGSVDGDAPAAMRYTEARLHKFAMEMLSQIDRNTVDFVNNFDETLKEPLVLPSAAPNLLVNGASGIAVGMATNIPPHNLGEVVDAMSYMLERWEKIEEINVEDLMQFVKGPDFPTGGIILQESEQNDLLQAYATGRGKIKVRGRVQLEEMGRGRSRILITELPYMTNKAALIERIAELVRDGQLEGISDLRDESDRHGMRVVIELKQGADADNLLRELYKRTPMQTTFGISLLALVNGEPHMLTLKQALRVYLDHRLVVVRRRTEFDLDKARARAHILEGLRIAINNLDEIITTIRNAPDTDQARQRLIKRFKLSELQANAILDMQLKRLAALERKKIELEYKEVMQIIKDLESLLKSPKKMREVVEEELKQLKASYGDRRRTQIVFLREGESAREMLTTTDLTPARGVWVGVTLDGAIARTHGDELPPQTGREVPRFVLKTTTHETLYLVTDKGKAAAVSVEALPEAEVFSGGVSLHKVSPLDADENLVGIFSVSSPVDPQVEQYALTISAQGMVKKSSVSELPGPSAQAFVLAKVNPGDQLKGVMLTDGKSEILLLTSEGMGIRFAEDEVRAMGLVAAGVNGIKLAGGDTVASGTRLVKGGELLIVSSHGSAWRIHEKEFPRQGRYGQGVKTCKLKSNDHLISAMIGKSKQSGMLLFREAGAQTIRISVLPTVKRFAPGKEITLVAGNDELLGIVAGQDGGEGEKEGGGTARTEKGKKASSTRRAAAETPVSTPAEVKKGKKSAEEKPVEKTSTGRKEKPAPAPAGVKKGKKSAEEKPVALPLSGTTVSGETKPAREKKPRSAAPTGTEVKTQPTHPAAGQLALDLESPPTSRTKKKPAEKPSPDKPVGKKKEKK